ncbi:MAG: ERF family protein [Ignavibacteriaceae bacterium]|nr:ERF family protein [Ignavibacteriaceae bacterium]
MNKLLEFQKKVGAISKNSINPFFKSNYFDINKLIDVIKPILNEIELVLLQPLENINGKSALRTIIYDVNEGGCSTIIDFTTPLPENPDPQKMGSIITYFRRYAIQSLLFLQAEDDDGNSAAQTLKTTAKQEPRLAQKNLIVSLLKKKMPEIKTPEDYQEACMRLTGYELLPANYDNIINSLK